ncbi:hydrogenase nickel incorporation protein HypB [Desulfurivibrio alkaliphilus]|uniref:Hydrogenase accessory protein HypB n=1 Tax=Desulfurivibrio alkaliphilus (strain DSM 19089 / UNIQEM U267 / AHT2) TaxID=589865 RepID=D6Z6H6_DESAT|nr:hydrogenase nickel incorporation protein HypB [Desulfurivibrio alkaliphilus]ADH84935.1 hydrogenase accessory protein HypB [Desulfurivibrio alkaliphilus AHT 2]
MCDDCGCGPGAEGVSYTLAGKKAGPGTRHGAGHHHHHGRQDGGGADDGAAAGRRLQVARDVLAYNNQQAEHNRQHFKACRVLALNLVSSPGSGKTTLLEQTIRRLGGARPVAVIEGDQQTLLDAERIEKTGVPVVQVNTGAGCHLDAAMVHRALHELELADDSLLFIENVGNLVCPAMFDLGEAAKVVIISVTEGEDKPLKYPAMFAAARLCLINKIDLLPHLDFDLAKCREYARRVNPDLQFIAISARSGEGMEEWLAALANLAATDPEGARAG